MSLVGAEASVVTPLLCVPWVAAIALLITAWAFREGDEDAQSWRCGVAIALLVGGVVEVAGAFSTEALGGHRFEALGVTSTPWTALVDACAAVLGALAIRGGPHDPSSRGVARSSPRRGVPLRAALGVVVAVSGCVHSTEFLGIVASLGVLVVSLFVAQREGEDCGAEASLRAVLWCVLGLALIFAGTSTLNLERLPSRMMMVFTRWGGAQERLADFRAGAEVLPGGLLAQLRGEVIRGIASASLALGGLFVLLAGILSLVGAFPFRLAGEEGSPCRGEGAGVLWMGAVIGGCALLVSLFLDPLHSPRMVREPYGWVGVLPTIGALTVLVGAVRVVVSRDLRESARAVVQVGTGVFILSVAASASFLGQAKYVPREAARRGAEEMWARVAAESSLAGGIGMMVASLALACLVCVVVVRSRSSSPEVGDGTDGLTGLMGRSPVVAVSLLVGCASFVGVAPGVGAEVWFDVYRGLGQHGGMAWTLAVVGTAHVCVGVGLARRLLVMFDEAPDSEGQRSASSMQTASLWGALLALCLLAGGPATGALHTTAAAAASGIGFVAGSTRRDQWTRAAVTPRLGADPETSSAPAVERR